MKTQTKLLWVLLLTCSYLTSAYAATDASIKAVTVVDKKTVSVSLVQTLEGKTFTGDAKILKDLAVKSSVLNPQNAKVVNVTLATDLLPDTSYSILSIFGAEGNMDFTLKSAIANTEFANTDAESAIEKIVVKDSKDIDIYYKLELKSEEIEYKVLSNLGVDSIVKSSIIPTDLTFTIKTPLEENTAYILMLVGLKDEKGGEVNFEEGIYDFTTKTFTITTGTWAITGSWVIANGVPKTGTWAASALPVASKTWATLGGGVLVDLNAATTITEGATSTGVQSKLTESIAATASQTPDTWAETWVLILATLIINTVFFYTRRKSGKVA